MLIFVTTVVAHYSGLLDNAEVDINSLMKEAVQESTRDKACEVIVTSLNTQFMNKVLHLSTYTNNEFLPIVASWRKRICFEGTPNSANRKTSHL